MVSQRPGTLVRVLGFEFWLSHLLAAESHETYLNSCKPQFPHLSNSDNNSISCSYGED